MELLARSFTAGMKGVFCRFYVSRQRLYSNKFYDSLNTGAVLTSKQTKIVILTSSGTFPNSHVAVNVHHFSLKRSKLNESIESGG